METNRRAFLATLAAAAVAAAKPGKVTVAAHPWVYAATRPHNDTYEILPAIMEDMSAAGMDAIELMGDVLAHDGAVERISDLSRRNRLPVLGMSYSAAMWDSEQHPAILKEAQVLIPRLAKLGGRTMGTTVGSAGKRKTAEQLDAQAEVLRKIIAICRDNGVVLNLHNHTFEVKDGEYDLKGTLERIPDVKLGPDLNWLLRAGVDPVDFIHRYRDRIVFAHLRDQKKDGKWPEAMGEGDMEYAAIGKAFHEIPFTGDLAIELAHERGFTPTRPLRESLRMSREYVRRVMGY